MTRSTVRDGAADGVAETERPDRTGVAGGFGVSGQGKWAGRTERFVITRAEVDGRIVDVAVEVDEAGGRVCEVGSDLATARTRVVDAAGGALLPGLHDHHIHLFALAASYGSVRLDGDSDLAEIVTSASALAPRGTWLRVVGLDDAHGPVDRDRLDRLAPDRPIRVQHRSGAAWVLNSRALAIVGRSDVADGWLHRVDEVAGWPRDLPDLSEVGSRLARMGVTGVTDATPFTDPSSVQALASAHLHGALPQRLVVTGAPSLSTSPAPEGCELGPVKVVVGDHSLPAIGELVDALRAARRAGRSVAVHCVTRVGLVLALAGWEEVGAVDGDRIEHGSVIPAELIDRLVDLGIRVVTQPGFVADRGDRYLSDVEPDDRPHLYRCASLLAAGIPVAGSTDAPFGPEDPWAAIAAAIDRRTKTGAVLGAGERVDPAVALGMFLGSPDDPGGPARRVATGARADLCLLDRPLASALADPSAAHVRSTWIGGRATVEDQRA